MIPSGEQYGIEGGEYAATVTEVGAVLRELRHGGRDLVLPFGPEEICPHYRGAVLAPWPNRIADGRYESPAGSAHQLALSEPARHNAMHGLVHWSAWQLAERDDARVVLTHRLHASTGYPFQLDMRVTYALAADGLRTSVEATNTGEAPAPYGCAPHPYLVAGDEPLDTWTLEVPAERYLEVTPDRLLPVAVRDVAGTEKDFREAHPIGGTKLDHAYTGLRRQGDGRTSVRATAPSGTGVHATWDAALPWVQVHTGDRPEPEQDRLGLAVEPMTCPPDAFRSGTDLVVMEPGASHTATWLIGAIEP